MSLKLGVVCYPTVGGSGVIATEIATHAARSGHEVHLLSYERPARLRGAVPGLRFHAVDVSAYPLFRYPPYDLALATRMLDVQEEADLDLFHVHYAIPHAISAFLAQSMGRRELRWITTLHGTDITVVGADRAYMRPTRFALDASTAVTAVSQFLADETMLLFGTRSGIEVIPNFVDVGCFAATAPERFYDRADEERIAVHVSNLRPVKRVADVVRAFALMAAELPARLVLVGEGPDRDHVLAVAADLGCVDRVEAIGNIDREALIELLGRADVFLSASQTESFGLSMLEAMSCGVPCVSTDVGGVREVLGATGALVPLGDFEALARAALGFLRDPAAHREASAAARARAVAEFAHGPVLERYFELYRRVAAR